MGSIHGVCQASATFCKKLEADAIQAEFNEKQRDNPKNWSGFRQRIEAFESMKEVINEPAYKIPEAVVRKIIADIDGTKPEDVTWMRIGFEIARLGGPNRRHIEVVRSIPTQELPPVPEEKPRDQATKEVSEPAPASPPPTPKKTIADQLQTLREESGWSIEELAAATELSVRQVARHLAGEFKPYPKNIYAYEQAFSKRLKRKVVISKHVMKMS
jgi:hypothetical protein